MPVDGGAPRRRPGPGGDDGAGAGAGDGEYSESHFMGAAYVALAAALLGLYAAVVAGALAVGRYGVAVPMGVLLVVMVAALANFMRFTLRITSASVSFGFGVLGKRFDRADLLCCEPYRIAFAEYPGYGIRLGPDGSVAYGTRGGPGVRLVFEGAKRPYVVAVDEPAFVCGVLCARPGQADPC